MLSTSEQHHQEVFGLGDLTTDDQARVRAVDQVEFGR
jgi:hypothetical protein